MDKKKVIFLLLTLSISTLIFGQTFTEESTARGVQHEFQGRGLMGGGCAFFDFDNDGDEDLYLNGGWNSDALYINNNGEFLRLNQDIGLALTNSYYTCSVSIGDLDNDGHKDVLVTTWVNVVSNGREEIARNLLFRNNGDGTFQELGLSAGLIEESFSISSNLFDFNNDGLLDIYINNHVETPQFLYDSNGLIVGFDHTCYENTFYQNEGNMQFSEISTDQMINSEGCTLASLPTDFDEDGDIDLLVANDFGPFLTPNQLYQNNYPNPFTEVGASTNTNQGIYGMGVAIGDYDRDEDMDYYITNLGSNLLLNNEGQVFSDLSLEAGVSNEKANQGEFSTGWGTAFMDIDNDGFEDLFICNGRIPSLPSLPTAISDPDKLYLNNQDGTFNDISENANVAHSGYSRGMAFSDIDQDGDLDFFVMTINEFLDTGKLYINNGNNKNYISLLLEGSESNRDAIGSKIFVYTREGVQRREVFSGGASFCSQHSLVAHFGLDDLDVIDSVKVIWPVGTEEIFYDLAINTRSVLKEGSTTSTVNIESKNIDFVLSPNPFTSAINIKFQDDLKQQVRALKIFDMNGMLIMTKDLNNNNIQTIEVPKVLQGHLIIQVLFENHKPENRLVLKI